MHTVSCNFSLYRATVLIHIMQLHWSPSLLYTVFHNPWHTFTVPTCTLRMIGVGMVYHAKLITVHNALDAVHYFSHISGIVAGTVKRLFAFPECRPRLGRPSIRLPSFKMADRIEGLRTNKNKSDLPVSICSITTVSGVCITAHHRAMRCVMPRRTEV